MHRLALVFMVLSFAVNAAETSSSLAGEGDNSLNIKELLRDKKFEEDERITDLELRANAGSLNRYSLQFNLGYAGPPVNNLNNPSQPNPDNRPGDRRTSLTGQMGLRYRTGKDTGLNFGTGVLWYTPYQSATGQNVPNVKPGLKTYALNDPRVSFDQTYLVANTQARSSIFVSKTTTPAYVLAGQEAEVGFSQYFKYTPGTTRIILGFQTEADYFAFSRPYKYGIGNLGDGKVSRYYLKFNPSFEYKITDSLNFNTSYGYPYANLRLDPSWWRWNHPLSIWRLGAGWAITHDIYVNPYLSFFAEAPAINTASLSLSTVFSIF